MRCSVDVINPHLSPDASSAVSQRDGGGDYITGGWRRVESLEIYSHLRSFLKMAGEMVRNHGMETTFPNLQSQIKGRPWNREPGSPPAPGKLAESKKLDLHLKYLRGTELKRLTVVQDKVTDSQGVNNKLLKLALL